MTSLLKRALETAGLVQQRMTVDQYIELMQYNALNYPLMMNQTLAGHEEQAVPESNFVGLSRSGFKGNGTVFSCMVIRQRLFSEARFQFRQHSDGRPGKLFGTKGLLPLEHPWVGGVTGDLLARAIQDVDLGGNFFCARRYARRNVLGGGVAFRRMRPDWVVIILGSYDDPNVEAGDIDAEVVGYVYLPGGPHSGREPQLFLPEEVMHFAPTPDPEATYRGMPWLLPIIREYLADTAMITHKSKFLEHGATPNMVVTLDPSIKKEAFKEWVQMFSDKHEGVLNAYKTLYLGAGASILPVGKDFQQMEFAVTQAVGELRICAASGVPPVLVGVSEGIKAATYSNYQSAKRFLADGTLRPLWRNFATSMRKLIDTPANAELWYDDRDIPFLFDDAKDTAAIQQKKAATISSLVSAGYTPDSVVQSVVSDDLELLQHTGLFSVQLLPPGSELGGSTSDDKSKSKTTESDDDEDDTEDAPPAKTKTPAKSGGNGSRSRDEALALLQEMAVVRHALTAQAQQPNVDVHIHEGAFRADAPTVSVDARTTIEDGAFRVDTPVNVRTPDVVIAEGAVRAGDVHIAPTELRLEDGAIRVDAHIEDGAVRVGIESPVNIHEGAFRVDSPISIEPEFILRDGAIHVVTPVTIEEGAVRVEAPVTVERTEVHIDEGAVQIDSPVTVERSDVNINEGAFRVDSPVHVEPSIVTIEEGALRVDSPVHVEPSVVNIAEGAVRVESPVTVDAPVTIERGAVELTVEPELGLREGSISVSTPVTISEGAVRIEAPVTVERTEVHIDEGAVQIDSPVTVERTEVHIDEGAVRVDAPVTVERSDVIVSEGAIRMDVPEAREVAPPVIHITTPDTVKVSSLPPRITKRRVTKRNDVGSISETEDIETDLGVEELE